MRLPSYRTAKSFLSGAFDLAARALQPDPTADAAAASQAPVPSPVADAEPLSRPETTMERIERISRERFAAISSLFAQSELWKAQFLNQAAAHSEAHFLLERRLEQLSVGFQRAVAQLNAFREKEGLPPVDVEATLLADPSGVAISYRDRMAAIGIDLAAKEAAIVCPGSGQRPARTCRSDRGALSVCPVCEAATPLDSKTGGMPSHPIAAKQPTG